MIPTIENIVAGLLSGEYAKEQAIAWLRQHAEINERELRDYFAARFAHAEMVTAGALPAPARDLAHAATKAGRTIEQQVAVNAYLLADAMLAERAK